MFLSEGVHLVAFSAEDGTERWRSTQTDLPAQGTRPFRNAVYAPGRTTSSFQSCRRQTAARYGGAAAPPLLAGDTFVFGPAMNLVLQCGDGLFPLRRQPHDCLGGKVVPSFDLELAPSTGYRYLELEGERKQVSALRQQLGKQLAKLRKETLRLAKRNSSPRADGWTKSTWT